MKEKETETKLELVDQDSSAYYMMEQLADNSHELFVDVNGDELTKRTKLFMIAHARQQLKRIIKLTKFLEKLENKFIDAVNNRLENEPDSISMLSLSMETVTKCIETANSEVFQILKDERLQNIVINTTNIITPDGNSSTIIDPDSRDAVRDLASSLLEQLRLQLENEGQSVEEKEGED